MYKEGKVYMPKDKKLRAEIIRLYYDTPIGGHGGQWKTVELVTKLLVARNNERSEEICGGV